MYSSILCIITYGVIKLCDLCLTRIIHINLSLYDTCKYKELNFLGLLNILAITSVDYP